MANGKTPRKQLRSTVVRAHRWVGLISFLVLVVIAMTGAVLNHSVGLDLDRRMVEKDWVMRWYGMEEDGEPVAFEAGGRLVTGWGGRLAFGDRALTIKGELVGAVEAGDEVAVVCRDAIYLLDGEGALLEGVSPALMPEGGIERAGVSSPGGELAIRAGGGVFVFRGGFFEEAGDKPEIRWTEEATITGDMRRELARAHRGEGLPLYRIILDLHSGKFFGTAGVVVYDLAAAAVVLLSATGLWLAVRNFYRSGRGGGRGNQNANGRE